MSDPNAPELLVTMTRQLANLQGRNHPASFGADLTPENQQFAAK
jgi:hypothetical protein